MPTIRQLHSWLFNLHELQGGMIRAVEGEAGRVEADHAVANKKLRTALGGIVLVDDEARYAALGKAAQAVGLDEDYTGLVKEWRTQDETNRVAYAALVAQWGARNEVERKTGIVKEELNIVRAALEAVSPEIVAFDETTAKISAHNEKYPQAPITEDNHDGFETFKLGRFLLWLSFINRGPHKAYRIVSAYNKIYGDYYEDARAIAGLRKNEEELLQTESGKALLYEQLQTVGKSLADLDARYRGPENIAVEIAQKVYRAFIAKPEFAPSLAQHVPVAAVQTAGVAAAKMRALAKVKTFLRVEAEQLKAVRQDMERPLSVLAGAVRVVGGNAIRYDVTRMDEEVQQGIEVTNRALRDAEQARAAIENAHSLAGQFDLARFESRLHNFSTLTAVGNEQDLDFSNLNRMVRREIDEYEEEQRRRREAERAAREAQEALARAARQAAARMNQQRSGGGSISGSFGGAVRSGGIGGGATGIGGRASGGSIGGESRGIAPR